MKIKSLNIKEVEYTAFQAAKKFMTWNEPIPDFGTRFPNVLESCLHTPFQTFGRKPLYRRLSGKAAILFYLMIKNHPFENGNKRMAVMTLLLLLIKNHKWISISDEALYSIAVNVAKSKPSYREKIISEIELLISQNLIKA